MNLDQLKVEIHVNKLNFGYSPDVDFLFLWRSSLLMGGFYKKQIKVQLILIYAKSWNI